MVSITSLIILTYLLAKHWYVDFVNQSNAEVQCKGIYGNLTGLKHSIKHGILTIPAFIAFGDLTFAIGMGLIDTVIHYHVDFAKMRFGCRDINSKLFWAELGLDQFAHQLTYIGMVFAWQLSTNI